VEVGLHHDKKSWAFSHLVDLLGDEKVFFEVVLTGAQV
jgi:hypothetical protein